jgi:NitT/TauT family transport system substrate-binding protein
MPKVTRFGVSQDVCPRFARVALVFPLIVLLSLMAANNKAWGENKTIVISASKSALLVWIAKEKGLFRKYGLNVTLKLFESGLAAADAVINGEANLSTTSDSAFVSRSFSNADLRVLASIATLETSRLVGRKDRGIKDASDLAGKRLGITVASSGEYFLTRYLTLKGVPLSAPTILDLKPAQISEKLINGELDAGLTWEPFIRNAELKLKGNAVVLPDQVDLIYHFLLISNQSWIENNPENIEKILFALVEAERFSLDRPDEAKSLIQKKFGYESGYIDHLWPLNHLHVSLPQGLLFVLERQADWQVKKGLAASAAIPDFLERVDTAPLTTVHATAVGIVK